MRRYEVYHGSEDIEEKHGSSLVSEESDEEPSQQTGQQLGKRGGLATYVFSELLNSKLMALVTICSLSIVIGFSGLLMTSVRLLPAVFMRVNEDTTGSTDFMLIKDIEAVRKNKADIDVPVANKIGAVFLDAAYLAHMSANVPTVRGAFPRSLFPSVISSAGRSVNTMLLIGDSQRELDLGVGDLRGLQPLRDNEAYLTRDILTDLDLREGQTVTVTIPWLETIKEKMGFTSLSDEDFGHKLLEDVAASKDGDYSIPLDHMMQHLLAYGEVGLEVKIKTAIDDARGKWPSVLGNVAFVDQQHFTQLMLERFDASFESTLDEAFALALEQASLSFPVQMMARVYYGSMKQKLVPELRSLLNFSSLAMSMNYVVKDKLGVYGDMSGYKDKLSTIADDIRDILELSRGYKILNLTIKGFENYSMLWMFVQNLIYTIMMMLAIVCYFVLSAVTAMNMQEKTYQFGMLRALGATKAFILKSLLLTGLVLSGVGVLCGLLLERFLGHLLASRIAAFTGYEKDIGLSASHLLFFLALCFGLPLLTTLTNTSRAFLDSLVHSIQPSPVGLPTVVYRRLSEYSFSFGQLVLGFEVFLLGVTFYYVAPALFMASEYMWLFFVLTLVYMAAVIGGTTLGTFLRVWLQNYSLEKVAKWLNASWLNKLIARKSGSTNNIWLVVTFAVCFIIFTSNGVSSLVDYITTFVSILKGSDLVVSKGSSRFLLERNMTGLLSSERWRPVVQSFSFTSLGLDDIGSSELFIYGSPVNIEPNIFGIQQSFCQTIMNEFYRPTSLAAGLAKREFTDGKGRLKLDGLSSVFEPVALLQGVNDPHHVVTFEDEQREYHRMLINIVLPTGVLDSLGANVGDTFNMNVEYRGKTLRYFAKIAHSAEKVPSLWFSKYMTPLRFKLEAIISEEAMAVVLDDIRSRFAEVRQGSEEQYRALVPFDTPEVLASQLRVPKTKLHVKLSGSASQREVIRLKNELRQLMADEDLLFDRDSTAKALHTLGSVLEWINVAVSAIFCVLALFLFLIGSLRRIEDNAQEIGIIRSVGLSSENLARLLTVEMFIGLFSSLAVGYVLGLAFAFVGVFTAAVFFECPLYLQFAGPSSVVLLLLLVVSGYLATKLGFARLRHSTIATLLKGKL